MGADLIMDSKVRAPAAGAFDVNRSARSRPSIHSPRCAPWYLASAMLLVPGLGSHAEAARALTHCLRAPAEELPYKNVRGCLKQTTVRNFLDWPVDRTNA
jgi:hypothetical protein